MLLGGLPRWWVLLAALPACCFVASIRSSSTTGSRDPDGFMSPTVTIDSGPIVGTRVSIPSSKAIVDQFLGVPYAQSPPERFSLPRRPGTWSKLMETKKTRPACIQQFVYPEANRDVNLKIFNEPASEESEDCLYLNLYSSESLQKGRAVLFWLYPGGLQFGDASRAVYNGTNFAAFQDIIVVVPNYRSNVFGFPNSPELPLDSRNLGFYDQRIALEWVQRNIAAFGGDPNRVTIAGNSAGGTSVDRLVTTSPVNPHFRAAIIQSGQASISPYEPADGQASWRQLVEYLNCSDCDSPLACMRDKPVEEIKAYIDREAILFTPVTDNITQLGTREAQKARAQKNVAAVPVMIGSNGQEGSAFWRGSPNDLDGFLNAFFPHMIDLQRDINTSYPLGHGGYTTTYGRISAIFTDWVFTCPTAIFAKSSADAGYPTWRYFYNASFPSLAPLPGLGAYHTGEISIIFGTYAHENATAHAYTLSKHLQSIWAAFIKHPVGGPGWNKIGLFGPEDLAYLTSGSSGVAMIDPSSVDHRCALFAPVYAKTRTPAFWRVNQNVVALP